MGDCGAGTPAEKVLAARLAAAKPRFVLVPGDIVYDSGRERDYRPKFFDVYNADAPDPKVGAPVLRSIPFIASLGNHDVGGRDFSKGGDGLAYYYNFAQPLNGPNLGLGSAYLPHIDKETPEQRAAFMKAAGPNYPRMGNFSFEDGDVHFTLLDSDPYADWRDPMLQAWLRQDLFRTNARWKVVLFHHPPFNASLTHLGDQQMRVLSPLFEQLKVDLVVAGHEHNYQRARPLRYIPETDPKTGKVKKSSNRVGGRLILDNEYNGKDRTRPKYPLYIVTGAGGQRLYKTVFRWAAFHAASYSRRNSFSLVNVTPDRLLYRQIDEDGREVDRFIVDKAARPAPAQGAP
jgi:3',5'-cyclic AMP phosphodiesterase CpdA